MTGSSYELTNSSLEGVKWENLTIDSVDEVEEVRQLI